MRPRRLGGAIQDLNRLREILQLVARHGFGFLIDRLNLGAYLPGRYRLRTEEKPQRSAPERLRLLLEELGPTFIKLGQMLSMRPELIPPEYVAELVKLQDQVPPFSESGADRVLREELGSLARQFKKFQARPIAAASLAQVHCAWTRNNHKVAIKIQRPGLKRILRSDLEILHFIAKAWESVNRGEFPKNPVAVVEEFEKVLQAELDFLVEARHLERFQENFKHRPAYRFPKVYWELSTSRCLTLEYIEGKKISQLLTTLSEKQKQKLAQVIIDGFLLMVLQDRFFHADPHPGNFVLDPQGRLGLLDAGQVGRLDTETSEAFTEMLLALVNQDTDALVDAYLHLGTADESLDRRRLKKDTELFLEQYYALPVQQISFGKALMELIILAYQHKLQLPAELLVLGKTFMGVEGLARQLNPELNLIAAARPTAKKIVEQHYTPGHLIRHGWRRLQAWKHFIFELPSQIQDLLAKLQQGRLKIEFEHLGLEDMQQTLEHASNRLSLSLIAAALIVGSCLIVAARIGPAWQGISLLGLTGFLMAALLSIWLLLDLFHSRRR